MISSELQKGYGEISRLVLNPRSKDIKLDTYSSFVLDVLFDTKKNSVIGLEDIVNSIVIKYDLKGISPKIVEDSLKHLASIECVQEDRKGFALTEVGRKKTQRDKDETKKIYQEMLDSFVKEFQAILGSKLDDYQKYFVRDAFEKSLYEIFENLSQSTVNYIEGLSKHSDVVFIKQSILRNANAIKEPIIDNAEKIKSVLPDVVEKIFNDPSETFSNGLLQCANKHVMWRILGVDPELKKFRSELFKNVNILLDTNILIAGLCDGSARHKQTIWILEATKSVGVHLLVSDYTIAEFANAVNYADYLHEQTAGKEISPRILNNEITRTYYISKKRYTDWAAYIAMMKQGAEIFVKNWKTTIIESSNYHIEPESIDALKKIIRSFEDTDLKEKPDIIIKHDAINLLLVQAMRKKMENAPFNSPWFVTHHDRLRKADNVIRKRYNYPQLSSISCDAWFELIYPFIWAEVDPLEAAKVFTKIVATSVLPIQAPTARSFVRYVATELQLPVEDENIIKRIIEESHLRRVLEKDLARGDMQVALSTFTKIIGSKIELEHKIKEKENVIRRLVERVKSLRASTPEVDIDFDRDAFKSYLKNVEIAKTNDEKKKSLESFANYFVSIFHGWKVVGSNIRTKAEEIDLMVQNASILRWGDPILVECKNWSRPIGKDEVVLFLDKLIKQRCSTGILFARNGITGSERANAGLRVREALWKHGIRIIVISLDDLNSIMTKEQLRDMMMERYYEPTKHLR